MPQRDTTMACLFSPAIPGRARRGAARSASRPDPAGLERLAQDDRIRRESRARCRSSRIRSLSHGARANCWLWTRRRCYLTSPTSVRLAWRNACTHCSGAAHPPERPASGFVALDPTLSSEQQGAIRTGPPARRSVCSPVVPARAKTTCIRALIAALEAGRKRTPWLLLPGGAASDCLSRWRPPAPSIACWRSSPAKASPLTIKPPGDRPAGGG